MQFFLSALSSPESAAKVDEVLSNLGDSHVQFELWEAKDIRQLIKAYHNIVCPSLYKSHLEKWDAA